MHQNISLEEYSKEIRFLDWEVQWFVNSILPSLTAGDWTFSGFESVNSLSSKKNQYLPCQEHPPICTQTFCPHKYTKISCFSPRMTLINETWKIVPQVGMRLPRQTRRTHGATNGRNKIWSVKLVSINCYSCCSDYYSESDQQTDAPFWSHP